MKRSFAFIFSALILINPSQLLAVGSAGFENASYSAKFTAEGNAGVARPDEAAAISYNPAGIVDLPGIQTQSNIALIGAFTRHSSFNGNIDQSGSTHSLVPTGYLTINPGDYLGNRFAFGIGSDSPFGLSNRYDSSDSYVRYTGFSNYLKMYTIKPTIAVKLTDWLSLGGGPVYNRIFDFGGVQAYPNVLLGGTPADGLIRLNESGNKWSWQMGLLAKPHKKHQLGFYFRSPIAMRVSGLIKVEGATIGNNFETGGDAKLNLPLNFTWAYAFLPNEKTSIEMDFGYTRWSTHKRLFFNHTTVGNANDTILNAIGFNAKDYNDGYSLHLGGNRKITDRFTLRAGSFFYWSVVPDDHYIPAVPDGNRLGLTFGSSLKATKNVSIDLAYMAHLTLRNSVDNSISETLGTSVDGKYFTYIQGFYVTVNCKFENVFNRNSGLDSSMGRIKKNE